MHGNHALSASLEFESGNWEIDGQDYEEEFRDAVETVRNDHDEEVIVEADTSYFLKVRWNEKTDEVRFDVFALSEVFALGGEE